MVKSFVQRIINKLLNKNELDRVFPGLNPKMVVLLYRTNLLRFFLNNGKGIRRIQSGYEHEKAVADC